MYVDLNKKFKFNLLDEINKIKELAGQSEIKGKYSILYFWLLFESHVSHYLFLELTEVEEIENEKKEIFEKAQEAADRKRAVYTLYIAVNAPF